MRRVELDEIYCHQVRKKKTTEKIITAYEIAKQISEATTSYWEAMSLIELIKENFEWAMRRTKPELPPYPVDRFGVKIELPENETPRSSK